MTSDELLRAGDRLSSAITSVGRGARTGTVKRVIGGREHPRYEVEWDGGGTSIVYRAHVSVEPKRRPAARARPKRRRRAEVHGLTAAPGDRLVIRAHRQGEPERDAEILEVLGPQGTAPFRVQWSDTGQEVLFFPGADAYVEHLAAKRTPARRR